MNSNIIKYNTVLNNNNTVIVSSNNDNTDAIIDPALIEKKIKNEFYPNITRKMYKQIFKNFIYSDKIN